MRGILFGVNVPYVVELQALEDAYTTTLAADIGPLRAALDDLARGPAAFIGSGGTMVLAHLAARLHEWTARQPARACTALEAVDLPQLTQRGALLFTSSGKHPDARRVMGDFRRARFRPTAVLTHRSADAIADLAGPDARVVQLPALRQPDGFLATGSVLQMAVALLRGCLNRPCLPVRLPYSSEADGALRGEVLVLTPPPLVPVACDIEVRLVESGLAAVQVADYRNFAHGRHTGFARRLNHVTVIALSDAVSEAVASATLNALPARADIRRWHCDAVWPGALVSLLVRSMWLAEREGMRVGLDVARPVVPAFGRRLYRLSLGNRVPVHRAGAIERKLLALGAGDSELMRATYRAAAREWSARLRLQRFGAIVLDYDGTVCWTRRRRELPDQAVRQPLQRLLKEGLVLGFASGRGQSLHRDLRRWLPDALWTQVLLGLYNGAVRVRLDEPLPDLRSPSRWSSSVVAALMDWPFRSSIEIEERGAQVTVELAAGAFEHGRLDELVRDHLSTAGVAAQVLASGHSLDIVSPETRKTTVIEAAHERCGTAVLAIGDQGQVGGNDHGLLAHGPFSLTVDRCSADPTRCWYAGSGEHVGPELLVRYLRALRRRKGGFTMVGLETL